MENPYCPCGCRLLVDDELDYFCAVCGFRITRSELKRLEEFRKDAKAFM